MKKISMAAARKNARMTQAQMAEALRMTRQTYAALESNKSKIKAEDFLLFCEITGFSPNEISLHGERS